MTAKTLEREAREESKSFAKKKKKRRINKEMGQIGASERGFYFGFKAAATAREKEIEELRAKLEAVPVEEIRRRNQSHILDGADAEDVDAIDRWLSTVTE